ncbi:CotH kinase family protein [Ruminococcus sp.]|uniref:CotH kinase family protein n=1 Tax=Ruminococcus sp. TaxID=41978 RepID=UPI0025D2D05A|nr:CotH kinase family protein [Ruminococcus sp.]MBQ9543064.1 CotH kinase family protein [Ruminococcus sp.]
MKRSIVLICAVCLTAAVFGSCASNKEENGKESSVISSAKNESSIAEEQAEDPTFVLDDTPVMVTETPMPDLTEVKAQYAEKEADISAMFEEISALKDAPCINITTESDYPVISKDSYVAGMIDVFNCDDAFKMTAAGGVKVRGNSSADQGDEKPYRIKFEEEQNMLGLHDGNAYKSWVLLRSYWNLGTDYTAQKLAKTIFDGKYYNTDIMFVNLYINGEYKGIYDLCEQNQAAVGRVDVHEPKKDDNSTEIGYLLEIDNYPDETHPFFVMDYEGAEAEDISGQKRKFVSAEYSIKSDINTQGQLDFIGNYTAGVFKILYEAAENDIAMKFDTAYNVVTADDMTPQEAVSTVIDLESLADMLILEELVHNYDVGEGSFYMARDFSADSVYEKLTFLAPWDFNWAYEGNADGSYYACTFQPEVGKQDRSNPWFITAMKAEWFKDIVKERWSELSESGVLRETAKNVIEDSGKLENDLGEDAWKIDKVVDIISFVYGRIDFLDDCWK